MKIEELLDAVKTIIGRSTIPFDFEKCSSFLTSVINGDQLAEALPIDVKLASGKDGIVIYALTNARLIRIRISSEGYESFDVYLKEALINRSLSNQAEGNNTRIRVESTNGYIGLRYTTGDKTIEDFFSKVELAVRDAKKSS